jgi:hypothetical protein
MTIGKPKVPKFNKGSLQANHIRGRIGKVGIWFIGLIFKMATISLHEDVGYSKSGVLPLQMQYFNKYSKTNISISSHEC